MASIRTPKGLDQSTAVLIGDFSRHLKPRADRHIIHSGSVAIRADV
jgi:hypothetical protein